MLCGQVYCPTNCPGYRRDRDPWWEDEYEQDEQNEEDRQWH